MSESLVRLRVDSQEYDQKIKQAAEGLRRYADACKKIGGTLEVVEEETLQYVRAIGRMETVSRTATGKLSELNRAFSEFASIYKQMSDAEKRSPVGKALAQSLEQLKTRIKEGKFEINDINKQLNGGGGLSSALDTIASKFGISTQMLTGMTAALGATAAAVKFTKDVFMNSEAGIDEWERVVESSKVTYEAFLTSINNGDVSGFLTRIDQIQNAAIEAYNALDLLRTQKVIEAPAMSAKQTEIERMQTMLRTGRYIAPLDGRTTAPGLKTGDILSKAQRDAIAKNLEEAMAEIVKMSKSQVSSATTAIDKLYKEQAAVLGVSKKDFLEATSSWENFSAALEKSNNYWEWRSKNTEWVTRGTGMNAHVVPSYNDANNPYRGWGWVKTFKDDGELYKRIVEAIQNRDSAQQQLYGQYSRMYRTVNRATGVNPFAKGSAASASVVAAVAQTFMPVDPNSILGMTNQLRELASVQQLASDTGSWEHYQKQIDVITDRIKVMKGEMSQVEFYYKYSNPEEYNALMSAAKSYKPQKEEKPKEGDKTSVTAIASQIGGGVNSIASGIEQLGVELPQGFKDVLGGINAVTTILTGIAAICTVIQTLSSIQTARGMIPFFAKGGIARAAGGFAVPGNRLSGDRVPALLNSQELVLNRAQTGIIASALNDSKQGIGYGAQPYVMGEQIWLGLNAWSRRSGRGEIVTSKR